MESLIIKLNSVVAPLIEGNGSMMSECNRIKRLAQKEVVELYFFDDKVRITGKNSRKVKVPAKALKNGAALISWMEQRIQTAWN